MSENGSMKLEHLLHGMMRHVVNTNYAVNYEAKVEDMLAKARLLSVSEDRVRELIAAEHERAVSSTRPFSWDTISDQITRANK